MAASDMDMDVRILIRSLRLIWDREDRLLDAVSRMGKNVAESP